MINRYACPSNCPDRELYCHSKCLRYKKYRAVIDQISEAKQKEKDYIGYLVDTMNRFKKY